MRFEPCKTPPLLWNWNKLTLNTDQLRSTGNDFVQKALQRSWKQT